MKKRAGVRNVAAMASFGQNLDFGGYDHHLKNFLNLHEIRVLSHTEKLSYIHSRLASDMLPGVSPNNIIY
jgi:hypothetical protein